MNSSIRLLAIALTVVGMAACKKPIKENPPAAVNAPGDTTETTPDTGMMGDDALWATNDAEKILAGVKCLQVRTINFDLDRTEISGQFQDAINCHARFLKAFSSYKLTLGGHADERGTREYNLGLGERRNNAVSDAVKAQGASGSQIEGVSYGEEQPTCTESEESCWANNRRVEFSYSK
jgi:peptidoglycan-associated lipoprotein